MLENAIVLEEGAMLKPLIRAVAAFALAASFSVQAAWPERPVTIIVPWGAGGAADQLARVLASLLEQDLKQPFNVVQRTGGSGVVGHQAIVNAKPDGYTLGLATVEITMFKHQGLADFNQKDYTIVAIVNTDAGGLMVRSDSPYKTAKQLIDDIKAKPAQTLKASGTGQGGIWHLGLIGWLMDEGVDPAKVPWVPSQGSAPAMQDLVAGGVHFVTASLPEGRTFMEAGRVRALANMDKARLAPYTDAPTLKEATGSNWTVITWRGVVGPKGLPKDVMDRLVPALQKAHSSKVFRDMMTERGFGVAWMGPEEGTKFTDQAYDNFGKVMKAAGMTK
jgi:tripartite-type tricarboxylate transporter receptor subunit TctC